MSLSRAKAIKHILDRISIDSASGCWLWTGPLSKPGYGWVRFIGPHLDRSSHHAHRIVYEMYRGPIPTGLQIDHLCRVKSCVNPDHLEAVTARVNVLRSNNITALNARKTHCPKGHPLSGENLYMKPSGFRTCRICKQAQLRAWRQRHK